MEVALYIHIPFCASKCSYCDFYSLACKNIPTWYIDRLEEEFFFRIKQFNIKKIKSLYFGGGTPSYLLQNTVLKQALSSFFSKIKPFLSFDAECSFECNPDDISEEACIFLKSLGINRISLGIQSFNNTKLAFLNRRSSKAINEKALSIIQKAGFSHFSADLISGLAPLGKNFKTEATELYEAIDKLISFGVDHISLYSLIVSPGTLLEKQLEENPSLFDEALSEKLWIGGRDYLEKKGFMQYEVSNFSLPGCESQHNLCYWDMETYLGLGAGATGSLFLPDGKTLRYENTEDLEAYKNRDFLESQETECIEKKDAIFEYLMMGFRKNAGISASVFSKRFSESIESYIEPHFSNWEKKSLAKKRQEGSEIYYALTKKGLLFLNQFLEALL